LLDHEGIATEDYVYERVTNTEDSTLPKLNREYVKLAKVYEDPNGFIHPDVTPDPSLDTERTEEDYGLFLLDTRAQSDLLEQYTANCADSSQYFGMAFAAIDDQGHSIVFTSPKTGTSKLKIHGW